MTVAAALSIAGLVTLLQGVGPERESAIDALADSSEHVIVAVLEGVNWRGRDGVVASLERATPPRVEMLTELSLSHPKLATRRSAIRALGRVGAEGTCAKLVEMLGQGSDAVILDAMRGRSDCRAEFFRKFLDSNDRDSRRRAFLGLTEMDPDEAGERAVSLLGDQDHGVRYAASTFLVKHLDRAIGRVVESMSGFDQVGRLTALELLGRSTDAQAAGVLEATLNSKRWPERRMAALSIGANGGTGSLKLLKSALDRETHVLVREAMQKSVEKIEAKSE